MNTKELFKDLKELKAKSKWLKIDSYRISSKSILTFEQFEFDASIRFKLNNKVVASCGYTSVLLYRRFFAVTQYYTGVFPVEKILKWEQMNK